MQANHPRRQDIQPTTRPGPVGPVYDLGVATIAAATIAAAASGRRRFSGRDILTLLWHSRWIWVVSVGLGVATAAVVNRIDPPAATATALLFYPQADDAAMQAELAIQRGDPAIRDIVARTGAARVAAPYHVAAPFDRLVANCPAVTECAEALVRSHLQIERGADSGDAGHGRVLAISARSPDPAVAIALAAAAIQAGQAARKDAYATTQIAELGQELARAEQSLAATAAAAERIRLAASVLDLGQDIVAATQEAAAVARRDSQLRERQMAVEAELARTNAILPATPEQVPFSREVSTSDGRSQTNALLERLQLDRAHMASLYAPGYPGLVEIDDKIALLRKPLPASTASVVSNRRNANFDMLSGKVVALQIERDAVAGQLAELHTQSLRVAARQAVLRDAAGSLAELGLRHSVQQDVVRQTALDMARLRAREATGADRVQDPRVLQAPSIATTTLGGSEVRLAIGAAAGMLLALAASALAASRRRFYLVAAEVERHLAVAELASIKLWREAGDSRPNAALRDLAIDILDAGPLQWDTRTVHMVGTAPTDGATQIASALAAELQAASAGRVLLVRLSADGTGDVRSLGQAPMQAVLPAGRTMRIAGPADDAARPLLVELVCALLGDVSAAGPFNHQVTQLRAAHSTILVVSEAGVPTATARSLAALADLNLMVVQARKSQAGQVARLSRSLVASGRRMPGFVFTSMPGFFAGKAA